MNTAKYSITFKKHQLTSSSSEKKVYMTIFRKKISTMLLFLSIILLCLITLLTTLLIISPGRLKSFVDQGGQTLIGSISEKIFIRIGRVEQGMFIRGKDIKNPVLLFVHGGPSFPEYFLVKALA